ncbi:MAG: hypothetical protein LBC95_02585 [Candidatus Nomurabacteria bacterium]|jgi:hypothetical protein|nr:hypothetical protein [Candidatus Nomurabacteria bacterium]
MKNTNCGASEHDRISKNKQKNNKQNYFGPYMESITKAKKPVSLGDPFCDDVYNNNSKNILHKKLTQHIPIEQKLNTQLM